MFTLSQWNIRAGGKTLEGFVRGVSQDKMAGFELTILTAVWGYHIYKDLTVGEEFACYQECANEHDRHAVAEYEDGDSNDILGDLPRERSGMLASSFCPTWDELFSGISCWGIIRVMWQILENWTFFRMHLNRFLSGDEHLEWHIFRENTVGVV